MEAHRQAVTFAHCSRWFATALTALTVCACIDDALGSGPTVGSGEGADLECSVEDAVPPPIVLTTSAGDQEGDQHSFCTYLEELGCGFCVDTVPITATHFNVVHRGDKLALGMPDGTLVTPGPERCQPDCPPQFTIRRFCSDELVDSGIIMEDKAWTVELEPGVYEITASGSFEADSLTGSTGVSLGLIVDDTRERAIVDVGGPGTVCDADAGTP